LISIRAATRSARWSPRSRYACSPASRSWACRWSCTPGFRSVTRSGTRTIREDAGLSWTYQTSLTALRLVDEGVLDAVPDLVVVHPHFGGVLP